MVNMESIVNITVVQPVNHHTTVAEPQGSVWRDVSLGGKNLTVITVRIINNISVFNLTINNLNFRFYNNLERYLINLSHFAMTWRFKIINFY